MTDTASDARAIINIARESTSPHLVEAGKIYVLQTACGLQTVDLTGDQYRELPRRKKGTVTVDDVASFAQYYLKHEVPASEVFADAEAATITAVLNAHGDDSAGWQDHRVILRMRKTEQWKAWTNYHGQMLKQAEFAEFIEASSADIAPDATVTAADLLEIAQSFQVHSKVQFASGARLSSGETQLVYTEDHAASAGKKGTIVIPTEFQLALRPFEDCNAYRVKARFRYRIDEGRLLLGYRLDGPEVIFRSAVGEVIEQAENACSVTIMRGQPG